MVRLAVLLGAVALGVSCSGSPSSPSPTPQAPACTYTLSTTSLSAASTGASVSIGVTTAAGCGWTATSSATFAAITSGSAGTGNGTVAVTVAENLGDARTATLTIAGQSVTLAQAASDPLFGNWSGTIAKGAGCPAALPASAAWTGTVRRNSFGQSEFVISVPSVGVVNQVLPLTLNGNNIQFSIVIDAVYTFNATLAADRRSFTGTFSGGSCSGTWSGART
jgi:hypothetical protein